MCQTIQIICTAPHSRTLSWVITRAGHRTRKTISASLSDFLVCFFSKEKQIFRHWEMRAGLVCRAWLRAGEQSFKSSPFSNYFPSWTLQHPISLMLHLQTLPLVSSHLSWLWKTACFQEIFWLRLRFQHCCSQVQQLFLLQLDSWMGPPCVQLHCHLLTTPFQNIFSF